MIVDSYVLISALAKAGCRSISNPRDGRAFCPSVDWLREVGQWLFQHRKPYQIEKYDCDDFALWAQVCATDALCQNGSVMDCGHSFRCADIMIPNEGLNGIGPGLHATNICYCSDETLYFLEPQTGLVSVVLDRRDVVILAAWL